MAYNRAIVGTYGTTVTYKPALAGRLSALRLYVAVDTFVVGSSQITMSKIIRTNGVVAGAHYVSDDRVCGPWARLCS